MNMFHGQIFLKLKENAEKKEKPFLLSFLMGKVVIVLKQYLLMLIQKSIELVFQKVGVEQEVLI